MNANGHDGHGHDCERGHEYVCVNDLESVNGRANDRDGGHDGREDNREESSSCWQTRDPV